LHFCKLNEAGIESKISHYNFCTNGSHYAGEANIPTIGIGPSVESLAHIVNEYIEIDQLLKSVVAYKAIMEAFTMDI
jgi:acetylornithine deacetylase/succinyl-diaminopimelate desuccinylase-like protein